MLPAIVVRTVELLLIIVVGIADPPSVLGAVELLPAIVIRIVYPPSAAVLR